MLSIHRFNFTKNFPPVLNIVGTYLIPCSITSIEGLLFKILNSIHLEYLRFVNLLSLSCQSQEEIVTDFTICSEFRNFNFCRYYYVILIRGTIRSNYQI